jgi:hypothetical protein
MRKQIKVKTTKNKFENLICDKLDIKVLGVCPYQTMDYGNMDKNGYQSPKLINLTLYYKGDEHIGTWQSGGGWYSGK